MLLKKVQVQLHVIAMNRISHTSDGETIELNNNISTPGQPKPECIRTQRCTFCGATKMAYEWRCVECTVTNVAMARQMQWARVRTLCTYQTSGDTRMLRKHLYIKCTGKQGMIQTPLEHNQVSLVAWHCIIQYFIITFWLFMGRHVGAHWYNDFYNVDFISPWEEQCWISSGLRAQLTVFYMCVHANVIYGIGLFR